MAAVCLKDRINAPIKHVFEVMTNIASWPDTISGISKVEVLSDGEFAVGTRWKETRTMMGKDFTEEMWVSELEPFSQYVIEADSRGARYRTEFKFKAIDNYTTDVTMDLKVTPITFAAKLMAPLSFFMKGSLAKILQKDLDDARVACEVRFQKDSQSSVR